MEEVKAIFLDLDGTLLHENNQASEYTKSVITSLRKEQYKVFIATGRSYAEIHMLVPEGFKVDGVISSNGTSGEVNGKNLFRHSLSLDAVKKIIDLAQRLNIYYEVFPFEGQRMVFKEDEEWMRDMIQGETPPNNVGMSEWKSRKDALKNKIHWIDQLPDTTFSKIYLFTPDFDKITNFREQLVESQNELQINVSNSSRYNAETMAYGIDKGTGIKEMIRHFNINQNQTLVIGDSDNDRAMFKFGHFTVAMKNAREEIKSLTDDVTQFNNEEDGAAKYLAKKFL